MTICISTPWQIPPLKSGSHGVLTLHLWLKDWPLVCRRVSVPYKILKYSYLSMYCKSMGCWLLFLYLPSSFFWCVQYSLFSWGMPWWAQLNSRQLQNTVNIYGDIFVRPPYPAGIFHNDVTNKLQTLFCRQNSKYESLPTNSDIQFFSIFAGDISRCRPL